MGGGAQWMPWISLDDAVALMELAIHDERFSVPGAERGRRRGDQPAAHPHAGHVLSRPTIVPVPAFALKLAFGEMASETILVSQRAEPRALTQLGYSFIHPELEDAIRAALKEDAEARSG